MQRAPQRIDCRFQMQEVELCHTETRNNNGFTISGLPEPFDGARVAQEERIDRLVDAGFFG
jgi:hypothetical protein